MLEHLSAVERTLAFIGLALTVLGALAGMVVKIRPKLRRGKARLGGALDALVGREPIVDPITGRELAPALPGIGVRMETVERAVAHIAELLDSQQTQDTRIADLERRVDALETGAIERVATKAESVATWRAVEAIAKSGDPTNPELEENP